MQRLALIALILLLAVPVAGRDIRREIAYQYRLTGADCAEQPRFMGSGSTSGDPAITTSTDPALSGRGTVYKLTPLTDSADRLYLCNWGAGMYDLSYGAYKGTALVYVDGASFTGGLGRYQVVVTQDGSNEYYHNTDVSGVGSWEKVDFDFTVDALSTQFRLEFYFRRGTGQAGQSLYMDDIRFWKTGGASPVVVQTDLVQKLGSEKSSWSAIASGEYTLDETNEKFIHLLDDAINVHGSNAALQAMSVDSISVDRNYRVNYLPAWQDADIYLTEHFNEVSLVEIRSNESVVLSHSKGADFVGTEFDERVDPTWLASATGQVINTLGYPYHDHDFETTARLREDGYIACRDGTIDTKGCGSYYYGSTSNVDWWKTWEMGMPYSLILDSNCMSANIQGTTATTVAMTALLNGEDLRWKWRQYNTWVQVFCHDVAEMDSTHLGAFLDAVILGDDCWIAPLGEIAEYYHARHTPSFAEPEVYDTLAGYESATLDSLPWNGKRWALTFSTDDGNADNYNYYEPCVADRGLAYSAFIVQSSIDTGTRLSSAQLHSLGQSDHCIVGMHAKDHKRLIPSRACQLTNNVDDPLAVELYDDAGTMKMKFYTRSEY